VNTLDPDQIKAILESAIFISTEPVTIERLSELFSPEERPTNQSLREILQTLETEYSARTIALKKVATGYRFQVNSDIAPRLAGWMEDAPSRYSRALLETLSLIAYKQPITRAEIEDVRGVSVSSSIIRTLQERDWIKPIGHRDVPGKPTLYGTTSKFLNDLNLQSLSQLPALLETNEEAGAAQLALAFEMPEEVQAEVQASEEVSKVL
jgi:segregation and condensation protein B